MSSSLRRILIVGTVAATATATLVGCSSSAGDGVAEDCTPAYEGFETVNPGALTVATYDFPPLTVVDGTEMSGVEGDLLNEVANRLCLTLQVESAGGANAGVPSVESGRADITAGDWYRTSAREEIVRLSLPVYLDQSGVISTSGLTVDDLEGHIVGSIVGNLWNDSMQQWLGDDFVIYQDDESLYGDLNAGRIDALIAGIAPSMNRLDNNPIEGATIEAVTPIDTVPEFEQPGQVGWPSSYDNEAFGDVLDQVITDMHEDGTIEQALIEWELDPSAADVGDPYVL
ncbi:MAG: substrate-binding periplasmic protein [Gulosibacter sp.]|uniref:substrate-binding periplasmic protein n=1 Tax=Gulosibacter sp. TaxID=2817531 RepID=UPI003F8FC263